MAATPGAQLGPGQRELAAGTPLAVASAIVGGLAAVVEPSWPLGGRGPAPDRRPRVSRLASSDRAPDRSLQPFLH